MMYLAVVLGGLLFLVFKLNKALARKDFLWAKFLIKNGASTLLNILSGLIIVWIFINEPNSLIFEKFLGDLDMTKCIFLGVFGQVFLTGVIQFLSKDTNTKLGINNKK